MKEYSGGCRCRKIRYQGRKDKLRTVICACEDCQKSAGAPFTLNVGFEEKDFQITKGQEYLKSYADMGESGKPVHRYFCQECGSALYGKPESYPGYVSLKALTMDEPFKASPAFVILHENIPEWIQLPQEALDEGKKIGG